MRIISGNLKGRRLVPFHNDKIRPMTDRVKESVFNTLTPWFEKRPLFLDLFSGTGNLSLEALSRGAIKSYAVEFNNSAIGIIKKNREILENKKSLIICNKDVFKFLKSSKEGPFDIIIADPPFSLHLGDKIMETLVCSHLYVLGTIIVIEISKQENLKQNYSCFKLFSEKDFNDKKVLFYECQK